jgi:hypothetical protein
VDELAWVSIRTRSERGGVFHQLGTAMEGSIKGISIGSVGVAILLVSYVRLFGFRFLSPEWSITTLAF